MACLAQVVNVIAPLKTTRDGLLKEATFYPIAMYAQRASGSSIRPTVEGAPRVTTKRFGEVATIDVAATIDQGAAGAAGRACVFIVHRGVSETLRTEVAFTGAKIPSRVLGAEQIWGLDPKAVNTFDRPDVVLPRKVGAMPLADGKFPIKLPPLSVTVVELQL
jgi:alpha-N-arabinofuranosidase